jgi:hypothetical protein
MTATVGEATEPAVIESRASWKRISATSPETVVAYS